MEKQYGQFLKNKVAKPAAEVLSWLELPHSFTDDITADMPEPALITGTFVFVFKGEALLLMKVSEQGWGIPGGRMERHETPEEAIRRTLFEETGINPLLLGFLGQRKITIEADTPPPHYYQPFPESHLVFYWAVIQEEAQQGGAQMAPTKLFMPLKAEVLDCIKQHKVFYAAALERARVVAAQMEE